MNRLYFRNTVIALVLLAASCKTGGTVLMDSVSEKDRELLVSVELDLLSFASGEDPEALPRAQENLALINAKETANREFLAWRACLNAEYLLRSGVSGNRKKAEKALEEAEKYNPDEQRVFVVKALLSTDSVEKRRFLTQGSELPWASRVWLDLGLFLYESAEFRGAAAAFDSAFVKVPEAYSLLFQNKRDSAFQMRDTGLRNPASVTILGQEQLTLNDLVTIIWNETDLMKAITTDVKDKKLFSRLLSEGFLSDPALTPDQLALRREAAFFLTALIALKTGQSDLTVRAAEYYRKKGWKSPIPDVALDAPWFGAAVYCVENDIMDLPDGVKFFPNRPVSGAEMIQTLKALKKLYPVSPKG